MSSLSAQDRQLIAATQGGLPLVPRPYEHVAQQLGWTEQQVREYCAQHLTGYKRPKVVEFRSELPKTPVGKILRRELRKAA